MAVKLDISKAYDRVEWNFLKQIMLKIGLPEQWVGLAMETVQTASYSFLINGEPRGHITPYQDNYTASLHVEVGCRFRFSFLLAIAYSFVKPPLMIIRNS